ncbi:MAG: YdhR family protein, partial [Deltaproteobacteria bacterium]
KPVVGNKKTGNVRDHSLRGNMITTVVQFKLPAPVTREKAKDLYLGTAPKYQTVEGLIRKYYLLSEDGGTGGGVYLWKSKAHAEKLFTPEWRQFIKERYGAEPVIQFFESPVLVDNLTREIIKD